jgi:hypothetical protein
MSQIRFLSGSQLDLMRALAPLAVAAIFIERAVEVLISPWREPDCTRKENAVEMCRVASSSPATDSEYHNRLHDLNQFKGNTKKAAYLLAFALSVIASLVGLRALGPLVADGGLNGLSDMQRHFFCAFDVLLTAALLPGGADLVHTVLNTFSSVFAKVQESTRR